MNKKILILFIGFIISWHLQAKINESHFNGKIQDNINQISEVNTYKDSVQLNNEFEILDTNKNQKLTRNEVNEQCGTSQAALGFFIFFVLFPISLISIYRILKLFNYSRIKRVLCSLLMGMVFLILLFSNYEITAPIIVVTFIFLIGIWILTELFGIIKNLLQEIKRTRN